VYGTLHCTFTVYLRSLVRTKIRDSDVLAWVEEKRKMSEVPGAFGLLILTTLQPVLA
jgi:hypothetical protein